MSFTEGEGRPYGGEHVETTGRAFLNIPGRGGRAYLSVKATGPADRSSIYMTFRIGDCNGDVTINFHINGKGLERVDQVRNALHKVSMFRSAADLLERVIREVQEGTPPQREVGIVTGRIRAVLDNQTEPVKADFFVEALGLERKKIYKALATLERRGEARRVSRGSWLPVKAP